MDTRLFLRTHLSEVSLDIESIRALAEELGLSWSSVRKAKRELKIISVKRGFPGRVIAWRLPRRKRVTLEERVEYARLEIACLEQRLHHTKRALADLERVLVFHPDSGPPPAS